MKSRLSLIPIALAAASCAGAFEADTHYVLTCYAALQCGYTLEQSIRIALACEAFDHPESATEPVQGLRPTALVQRIRADYHALANQHTYPQCLPTPWKRGVKPRDVLYEVARFLAAPPQQAKDAEAALLGRLAFLEVMAREQRNPGLALHYAQDLYSHAGYGTEFGHWRPSGLLGSYSGLLLPLGSATDYLSFDIGAWSPKSVAEAYRAVFPRMSNRNVKMVGETLRILYAGMRQGQVRRDAYSKVLSFLKKLEEANPMTIGRGSPWLEVPETGTNWLLTQLGLNTPAVSVSRAEAVIKSHLKEEAWLLGDYLPEWRRREGSLRYPKRQDVWLALSGERATIDPRASGIFTDLDLLTTYGSLVLTVKVIKSGANLSNTLGYTDARPVSAEVVIYVDSHAETETIRMIHPGKERREAFRSSGRVSLKEENESCRTYEVVFDEVAVGHGQVNIEFTDPNGNRLSGSTGCWVIRRKNTAESMFF